MHRARIEFKRFRYIWEALRYWRAPESEDEPARLKAMKELQTMLGEAQDAAVWMNRLKEYLRRHPRRAEEVRELQRHWESRRIALSRKFVKVRENALWRLKPL